MQWVTRDHPHTDRVACPWLIRKFIDPDAVIIYLPTDEILAYADRTGAISFDAKGARYTHRDGLCTFEVLVADHGLGSDPALALMARVVHGADVADDRDATPQSRGLLAIADGFALLGSPTRTSSPWSFPSTTRSTRGADGRSRRAGRRGRR